MELFWEFILSGFPLPSTLVLLGEIYRRISAIFQLLSPIVVLGISFQTNPPFFSTGLVTVQSPSCGQVKMGVNFCIIHYSIELQSSFVSTLYFRTQTFNIQVYKASKVYTYYGHTKLCILNIVPPFWKWFRRVLIIIMLYFLSS